jgi:hypothetical protein
VGRQDTRQAIVVGKRTDDGGILSDTQMAHPTRFERVTFAFGGQRSIQLSYGCIAVHLADWRGIGNGGKEP